jgi:hypothetical protein
MLRSLEDKEVPISPISFRKIEWADRFFHMAQRPPQGRNP